MEIQIFVVMVGMWVVDCKYGIVAVGNLSSFVGYNFAIPVAYYSFVAPAPVLVVLVVVVVD